MPIEYEPFSPRFRADPYPAYRALRESAPVHWAPEARVVCLARYDDVVGVLRRPEVFSSSAMRSVLMPRGFATATAREKVAGLVRFLWRARINPFAAGMRRGGAGNLITEDPPHHDVMRRVVNRGFTPRRIEAWRERAAELVALHLGRLRDGAPFDVIHDLAIPLPVTIIAEMLGVEPERHADFKRWSDGIIAATTGSGRDEGFPNGLLDGIAELYGWLRRAVRERRRTPTEDLIGLIVRAQQGEGEEGVLDEAEVFQFVLLLIVAGNETTTNLIGNAVKALLAHPEQLARAAADPALVPAVVEETLRFDPPIQYVFRTPTRDVEIAGHPVPKGRPVAPLLASANRDDARFPDGDRFDLARDPRGHLGFGMGVHFCLGASLARLEAEAALRGLIPELPRLEPAEPTPSLVDSYLIRGPSRLVLRRAAA